MRTEAANKEAVILRVIEKYPSYKAKTGTREKSGSVKEFIT